MQVGVKYKVVYLKCEGLRGSPVALAALANLRKWRGSAAVAYYCTSTITPLTPSTPPPSSPQIYQPPFQPPFA